MSKRKFPNWLDAYLKYAEHSEAPDSFHFWTGVSVIAGALRRRVWLEMGYFQWTPNFYIIFVAPPGIVSKSTTASIGMDLLQEISDIHFGPDVVTWQALVQSMAESTEHVLMADGQNYPMSCITIVAREFGTFLNPHDREMVDVLTSLWDGQIGTWKKATKTQGSDAIQNPWINAIACTTPAWIAGNMPEYVIGGGFMSRCIIVYEDEKRKLSAYPIDHMPTNFLEYKKDLIHDLELISMMSGQYTLSPDAKVWGTKWYAEHYERIKTEAAGVQMQGFMARKQTHIHKLAMVLTAAKHEGTIIEMEELQLADKLVSGLESNMAQIFETISAREETQPVSDLLTVVRRYEKIPMDQLFRLLIQKMTYTEFKGALESATIAGYVLCKSEGNRVMVQVVKEPNA